MQVLQRSASILHSFSALAAVRHAPMVHSLVEKANDVRILSSKYCEHHCILCLRLSCSVQFSRYARSQDLSLS